MKFMFLRALFHSCSSVFQGVVGFGRPAVDKICLLKLSLWNKQTEMWKVKTFSHKKMQFLVISHQGSSGTLLSSSFFFFFAFLPSYRHYGALCASIENIGEQRQLYLLCWWNSWKDRKGHFPKISENIWGFRMLSLDCPHIFFNCFCSGAIN